MIKWSISSALRGVSSAFREASAGDHTAQQILDEHYARGDTPGARSGSRSTRRYAGTYRRSERRSGVFAHFGTAVKALLNAAVVW